MSGSPRTDWDSGIWDWDNGTWGGWRRRWDYRSREWDSRWDTSAHWNYTAVADDNTVPGNVPHSRTQAQSAVETAATEPAGSSDGTYWGATNAAAAVPISPQSRQETVARGSSMPSRPCPALVNAQQSMTGNVPQSRTPWDQFAVATASKDQAGSSKSPLSELLAANRAGSSPAAAESISPQSRQESKAHALAIADIPIIYDLEYFRAHQISSHYRQHNVALKWLRDSCELMAMSLVNMMIFQNDHPESVAEIEHAEGTQYQFNPDVMNPWIWQDMVAQMTDESMACVVQGPEGRSRGIVRCGIYQTKNHDHKRHHANKAANIPDGPDRLKVWDFFLLREDGSSATLHPNYSNTKISYTEQREGSVVAGILETWCWSRWSIRHVHGGATTPVAQTPDTDLHEHTQEPQELPRSGKGGSSGPGTFTHFKNMRVTNTLQFDGTKKPRSR